MKKIVTSLLFTIASFSLIAQKDSSGNLGGMLKKAGSLFSKKSSNSSGLSNDQIVSGLKEALSIGAQKSGDKLSATDGFYKDAVVKILLPEQVRNVENKMRMLGFGKLIDNAELSLNRAAEDASKQAAPIFLDAIKKMTVTDALNILRGSDTAATSYLRKTTTPELTTAFRPVIEQSLAKTDANKYWKDVFTTYNKFSKNPVDTDINSYVTGKALNGLFYYVAQEEIGIRKNPAERVTDILKTVFGGK
ncbi:MAG TPA: DUF4197 domain-containing protein [Chitinophagaceae bacterium]|nr:DUF4197 domain-containing protein [Chitinophagaceae bacterium]